MGPRPARWVAVMAVLVLLAVCRLGRAESAPTEQPGGAAAASAGKEGKSAQSSSPADQNVQEEERVVSGLERLYKAAAKMAEHIRSQGLGLWRLGLLIVVIVAASWRVLGSWRNGGLSGIVAFALIAGMLTVERAVVALLPKFTKGQYALLLVAPIAVWAAVGMIRRLPGRTPKPRQSEWNALMRRANARSAEERRSRK